MRPSVISFGILTLALCGLILWQSQTGKNFATSVGATSPANPATIGQVEPPTEMRPISLTQTESPPWQVSFAEINGQPEWLQSQEELEELADSIPDEQLSSALDELARDQSSASVIVARRLLERWATESPETAAEWAAYLPGSVLGRAMCRQVVVSWAQKDLAATTTWTQQLAAGENKTAAVSALALEAATRGEASNAIILAVNLPEGTERDDLLSYAVQQWAAGDTAAAIDWIEDMQEPELRQRMLGNVAVDLACENPAAAAEMITSRMEAGPVREDALTHVVRFWAVSSPEQAAQWVQRLPDDGLRDAALDVLSDMWHQDQAKKSGM